MTALSARTAPTPAASPDAPSVLVPRSKLWTAKLVLLLGSMCAIAAFTTDTYLPSLPEVAADLSATEASVQFTITATLIGGAIGQFIIGPLSDRFGRRAPSSSASACTSSRRCCASR